MMTLIGSSILSYSSVMLASLLLARILILRWSSGGRSGVIRGRLPLPPGPKGHWLLGNEIPKTNPWLQFEEWTKQYGPVYTLRRGREIIIVIGRYEEAFQILEKEGALLADRPRSIAAGETLSGGMRTLLVPKGARLNKLRKALHAQLQPKAAASYESMQERYARKHILDILHNPEKHMQHARSYAASVVTSFTYGRSNHISYADPSIKKVVQCAHRLGETARPGQYLVDAFPVLNYAPGWIYWPLQELRRWHREELELFKGQMDTVRKKKASGQDTAPCFGRYILEHQRELDLSDDEIAYLAGSLFGAGSDTTASGISIVIMAAACFPEAQKKVQEELDVIIGRERVPTFADLDNLPQVTAFYLECSRWRPISVNGVMHRATKDIIWNEYCIPEGVTVLGSHWAIFRSPDTFPDPEAFNPHRWLTTGEDGKIKLREDLKNFSFGFGRRVCPGQHVANRSLQINTSLLLWAFNIQPHPDPEEKIDTLAFAQSANTYPLPFKVQFVARIGSGKEEELVRMLS